MICRASTNWSSRRRVRQVVPQGIDVTIRRHARDGLHAPLSGKALTFPTRSQFELWNIAPRFPWPFRSELLENTARTMSHCSELLGPPSNRLNLAVNFLRRRPPLLLVSLDLSEYKAGTSGLLPCLVRGQLACDLINE